VVVVDDDSAFRELFADVSVFRGYETRSYSRATDVGAVSRATADIVLLDVMCRA